jgi:uncharacterized membrane protein
MHKALWVVQVLLAIAFLLAGFGKLTMPVDQFVEAMPWVETTGVMAGRIAGFFELLGAIGLIAPSALRIAPKLTALAAAGLAVVMVLASGVHVARAEWSFLPMNLVLGSLAAFVAWGRFVKAPIEARSAGALEVAA